MFFDVSADGLKMRRCLRCLMRSCIDDIAETSGSASFFPHQRSYLIFQPASSDKRTVMRDRFTTTYLSSCA